MLGYKHLQAREISMDNMSLCAMKCRSQVHKQKLRCNKTELIDKDELKMTWYNETKSAA